MRIKLIIITTVTGILISISSQARTVVVDCDIVAGHGSSSGNSSYVEMACDDINTELEIGDTVQLKIKKTSNSKRPYVYRDRMDDIIEAMEQRARERHPEDFMDGEIE